MRKRFPGFRPEKKWTKIKLKQWTIFQLTKTEEAYKIAKKGKVCLFIIDLQLYDYSGMELAENIRELDDHKMTPMVFITGNMIRELFAFKTYHCYDYIIKPYSEKQVIRVLKTILSNTKEDDDETVIQFNTRPYVYTVKLSEILYVESLNRNISIHTYNGSQTLKGKTMTEIYKQLGQHFLRVHRSFIVNIKNIVRTNYSKREIFIKGEEKPIPIGKSKLNKVKERINGIS
jgi:two-component system LytT family response regulator